MGFGEMKEKSCPFRLKTARKPRALIPLPRGIDTLRPGVNWTAMVSIPSGGGIDTL